MSRKLIENARKRLQAEQGAEPRPWGGKLSVALVFPNTYHQAMSNLGFQTIYKLINDRDDALCERFFLPDPEDAAEHRKTGYPLFSLESGRFLDDFDVVAFSVSFENDYLNLPEIFELARIPLWAEDRAERFPLVICGGVCAFLNPEPLAPIMDLFVVGEGEVIVPPLLDHLIEERGSRSELMKGLSAVPGVYIPSFYNVKYHEDGTVACYLPAEGAPDKVVRQWVKELDSTASRTFVYTDKTEFSDMALTEISRGCSRGCRFCAAGFIYLPPRERSLPSLIPQVEEGLCTRNKIGLVAAAVSDYSRIDELGTGIVERGGLVSVSSLRIDSLSEEKIRALADSGHRTVALAPEAGSQRMRDLINKNLSEEQILEAVHLLSRCGILNLKLYFLIGLPGESSDDIEEMLELAGKIRMAWVQEQKKHGRLGHITLSVNPFIPKPFTPLQWAAMDNESVLKKKVRRIRSYIARLPNTDVIFESLRGAILQAFLARGDRKTAALLPDLAKGDNLKTACRKHGLKAVDYVERERGKEEVFPWEVIDSGVQRSYLWSEYERGLKGQLTCCCVPACRRCGVCD